MRINCALIVGIIASTFWINGCSQSVEDQLKQAQKDLRIGKFTRAQNAINEIAEPDSTSPEAVYGSALLDEYRSLEWAALLKHLEAAKMQDGYLPAIDAFTRLAIDLGYFENARRMAQIYIDKEPDNPAGYQFMASVYINESRSDSARIYLSQAETRAKDPRDIILLEAEIAFHSYDEEVIQEALARLSQTAFESTDHLLRLASLYHYLNMSDSAIHYSRRAVEKNSKDLYGRLQLAQYLFDEMRLEEAHRIVSGITSDAEEFGAGWILSAYIKWALGDLAAAEKDFYKYLSAHDLSPIPIEKHGDLYDHFGERLAAAGDFQAAYIMAVNLKMPDDYLFRLFVKMMNCMLEEGDYAQASEYYEEGARMRPGTFEMIFVEAELKSIFAATADSAKMLVDDRVEEFWDDPRWLEMAARYFRHRRAFDQAVRVYTRLIELPGAKLDYYLQLLDIYKNNNDLSAIDLLVGKLPLRIRSSRLTQEALLDIYTEAGKKDKALHYAEQLNGHTSEYLPYIVKLADLYAANGRQAEGRELLVKYSDRFPDKAESHYQLARFDFDNSDLETVPPLIYQSLAIDTGYAYAMELMGRYLQVKGQTDSAMVWYERAIRLNWPTPYAYYNLAELLYASQTDLSRAAGLAMGAVRFLGTDPRGYLLAGKIYYDLGNFRTAKLHFTKGKHMFPDDPIFCFHLGKTNIQLKDKPGAKAELTQALELNLPSPYKEEARKLLSGL